jgi:hypothetical protein
MIPAYGVKNSISDARSPISQRPEPSPAVSNPLLHTGCFCRSAFLCFVLPEVRHGFLLFINRSSFAVTKVQ